MYFVTPESFRYSSKNSYYPKQEKYFALASLPIAMYNIFTH